MRVFSRPQHPPRPPISLLNEFSDFLERALFFPPALLCPLNPRLFYDCSSRGSPRVDLNSRPRVTFSSPEPVPLDPPLKRFSPPPFCWGDDRSASHSLGTPPPRISLFPFTVFPRFFPLNLPFARSKPFFAERGFLLRLRANHPPPIISRTACTACVRPFPFCLLFLFVP